MLKYYWWKIRTKIVLFFASKISDGIFINIIISLLLPRIAYPLWKMQEERSSDFIIIRKFKTFSNY